MRESQNREVSGVLSVKGLSRQECLAYLAQSSVGRVAVSTGALPAIYTVLFTLKDEHLVFRVPRESRLRRALSRSVVAFSTDRFDPGMFRGWSVLVRGVGEDVSDPVLVEHLRGLPLPSWSERPEADHFVRLPVEHISGSQVC